MRVPTVFTAVDRFSDVVNRMTRNTNNFSRSASAAADRVSRRMDSIGKGMMTTSALMLASLAYPLNKAVEFEDQIASIATLLPELNSKGIQKLGNDILDMANKTSTPISLLTKSYYDLISAGVKQKDAMSWIKSSDKLSIAGLGELTDSTTILLASMRNFEGSFNSAEEAVNALFKTVKYGKTTVAQLGESFAANAVFAGGLGVTGQEYMASIAAITTSTLPTSMAEVAIGGLTNAISKTTAKKNKILFSIFKRLGVDSGEDLLKKKGGFLPALTAIKEEAGKAGIRLESVFGLKQASTAFIMLTKNQKVLEKYNESLGSINNKNEDALGIAYQLKMATGKFGIGKLKNNLDSVAIAIGTALIPAILEMTEILTPMLRSFRDWAKENEGAIRGFMYVALAIGAIGTAVTVGGWMVKLYGFFIWLGTLSWVAPLIQTIGGAFALAASEGVVAVLLLTGAIGLIIAAAIALVWVVIDMVQHWEDWRDIVLMMLGPIGQVILLVETLSKHWNSITSAFSTGGIKAGIIAIGDALKDHVLSILEKILNIAGRLPKFLGGGYFKSWAADIKELNSTGYTSTAAMNNITTFGGTKPTNLAGKNQENNQDIWSQLSKGGVFTINVNDPSGVVKDVESNNNVWGVKVSTSSTTGIKPYNTL